MIPSWEWMIVLAIIILLFGAGAIPKLARSLGRARKEFKEGLDEEEKDSKGEKIGGSELNESGNTAERS